MAKIKVPQQIKLGAHTYKIIINPHLWHDEKLVGCVNHRTGEIQIDSNLPDSIAMGSLVHEVLETINNFNQDGLSHDTLSRIAEGFTDFLLNNLNVKLDWSNIKS